MVVMIAMTDGIEVSGCPRFAYGMRQALKVLSGSPTFSTVKPFLAAIRKARASGLTVTWGKSTFRVGRATWQAPLLWSHSAAVAAEPGR